MSVLETDAPVANEVVKHTRLVPWRTKYAQALAVIDVLGVVTFGGPPPRLDDATIAHLRQHATPAVATPLSPVFAEGDWVRVAAGCLRGSEGRVQAFAAGGDRVCVLLCLLGHDVEISLPGEQLISRIGRPELQPARLPGAAAFPAARTG